MKNRRIVIIAIVLAIIAFGTAICIMWKSITSYNTALVANWEISIPYKAHYTEIYSKDSGPSFHGDGFRYHIFSYKDHSYVEEMLDWGSDEKETYFDGNYSTAVTAWLDKIDVPAEYRPRYSSCLFWYDSKNDHSEIIVLWDKDSSVIYVVESFM